MKLYRCTHCGRVDGYNLTAPLAIAQCERCDDLVLHTEYSGPVPEWFGGDQSAANATPQ